MVNYYKIDIPFNDDRKYAIYYHPDKEHLPYYNIKGERKAKGPKAP